MYCYYYKNIKRLKGTKITNAWSDVTSQIRPTIKVFSWTLQILPINDRSCQILLPLFLVDGHSTLCSLEAAEVSQGNNIILNCFLVHASHLMQLCDKGFFSSLKTSWKMAVGAYQFPNPGQSLIKSTFSKVFKDQHWQGAKCHIRL